MTERDRTIAEVCAEARIGRRTLEKWLGDDMLRAFDDRRFQFHTWRGHKRIWKPDAYRALVEAIERESEPGGVLTSKKVSGAAAIKIPFVSDRDARRAAEAVQAWPLTMAARGGRATRRRSSSTDGP